MRLQRFRGQRDDFGLLLDVHDGRWGAYQATNRQVPQCQSESLNPVPPTNSSWRRCSARPGVCQAQCQRGTKEPHEAGCKMLPWSANSDPFVGPLETRDRREHEENSKVQVAHGQIARRAEAMLV
jgi:hypothetical protein